MHGLTVTHNELGVVIDITDVEQPGTLKHTSKIKADTIASLEKSILLRQIARLKLTVFRQVIAEIRELMILRPDFKLAELIG